MPGAIAATTDYLRGWWLVLSEDRKGDGTSSQRDERLAKPWHSRAAMRSWRYHGSCI